MRFYFDFRDYVSRQLNLIPLIERVELQCVVAPAISSIIRTEKKVS